MAMDRAKGVMALDFIGVVIMVETTHSTSNLFIY